MFGIERTDFVQISYRERLDAERMEHIRVLLLELPRSCTDFIRGIGTTTSTLTRLAYVIDLQTFFDYALRELPRFHSDTASQIDDDELSQLKPRDIELYAEYLSYYFKSDEEKTLQNHEYGIMRKLSTLRSYFEYLFRAARVKGNIATLVPLPKLHEKPILFLEPDEVQRLLQQVENGDMLTERQQCYHQYTGLRDYAMLMLFLGTGIRVSECVGVDLEDIDYSSNALLVTRKGGNQVILYFPQEVAEALKAYLVEREAITAQEGHEHALFLSLQRRRMSQRAVQLMVKKYAKLVVPLKRKMSPHKLRSTYATNLYRETEDIYLVAEALGHSDVNTTRKHYAAMSDARRRAAAQNTHLPKKEDAAQSDDQKLE